MKFGNVNLGEITNVRTLEDDPSCYVCDIEITVGDEPPEKAFYVSRANDVTVTGKWVHQQIVDGNFIGQITHLESGVNPLTGERNVEEVESKARIERNNLLMSTDWTQFSDIPQATKDLWAPYRQALRDVPQQAGFPDNIVWPAPPQ